MHNIIGHYRNLDLIISSVSSPTVVVVVVDGVCDNRCQIIERCGYSRNHLLQIRCRSGLVDHC